MGVSIATGIPCVFKVSDLPKLRGACGDRLRLDNFLSTATNVVPHKLNG